MTGNDRKPPAICLMGPTASGKTGLAVELRKRFPLDIISVDSALVYRGMDIGTAKPDAATLREAPHELIDIREPTQSYSAAEFRADALACMESITANGRVPLLVGGTMLYFRSLLGGLAELPSADQQIRSRLERQAEEQGWPALHRRLAEYDPVAAERIHPNDPQRIQRALEVIELTGKPLSELHQEQAGQGSPYRYLKIVVCPAERSELHRRIEIRFHQMLDEGFLDEARSLYQRGDLVPSLPAMRCVGYRQAWSYLAGEIDREEMIRRALAATRQLAKRQLTWLRRENNALWYDLDSNSAVEDVFRQVADFLEIQPRRTNLQEARGADA